MKRNSIILLITLLFFVLFPWMTTQAGKKIFLMADPHVMNPSLVDSPDNLAWQAYLANSKKMDDLSAPVMDRMTQLIISERPDLLLIAGDLTKDAEIESHDYITNKLTEIKEAGIPICVIPGNHDYSYQGESQVYRNNTSTHTKTVNKNLIPERYKDFGYGAGTEIHESTLSYATQLWPGLTLIGIDTGQTAKIEEDAVTWVCKKAIEAKKKGDQVIVMMHHSLMPHIYWQQTIHANSVIEDHENIRDQLMAAGVKVVLSAHYHVSDITRYTDAGGQEIYDICTGSSISYPCDYRILTFDDQFKTLQISTKSLTDLEGYEDFPSYAQDRLHTAVKTWTVKRFSGLGLENIGQLLADVVADIFIIHAEGNEPQNPESEGIAESLDTFPLMGIFGETMLSILGDYPSREEIENVVNDRTLTITMPEVPTAIRNVTAEQQTNGPWYTLQGIRLTGEPTQPGLYLHNGKVQIK